MTHKYQTLEDTVYFWFGANDTSGSGGDGATPVYDVRLGGAAAGAAPVLSGSATLLSHADYPAGAHEVAIAATAANGFAAGSTCGVFCTLLVDSQNPTGFVGSFTLDPLPNTGTGARTVTVTVNDGSDPLESARVRFTKGAATYVQSTDASGNATFNLDDGTYTVAISLVGYTYAGSSQVVDGDETPTYSMTALTITAPSAATLCTVQFRVKTGNTAVSGAVCKAKLQGINHASDGTIQSNAESSDTSDADGIAELQLVQKSSIVKGSGIYKMWVEIDGNPVSSVERTIPNQSTFLFEDLLS